MPPPLAMIRSNTDEPRNCVFREVRIKDAESSSEKEEKNEEKKNDDEEGEEEEKEESFRDESSNRTISRFVR